jgi:hypothetical protein
MSGLGPQVSLLDAAKTVDDGMCLSLLSLEGS